MNRSRAVATAGLVSLALLAAACASDGGSGAAAGAGSSGSGSGQGAYGSGGGRSGGGGNGGGASTSGGGAAALEVSQNNFSFTPGDIKVASGDTITVKDANANTPHTFTVKGEDIDIVNDALQSQEVTIDLPAGTYQVICRFHEQLGMKAKLIVT